MSTVKLMCNQSMCKNKSTLSMAFGQLGTCCSKTENSLFMLYIKIICLIKNQTDIMPKNSLRNLIVCVYNFKSLSVGAVLSNASRNKWINGFRLLGCGYSKCLHILFPDSHGQSGMVSVSSGFTGFSFLQMTTAELFCSQMIRIHCLISSMPVIFQ